MRNVNKNAVLNKGCHSRKLLSGIYNACSCVRAQQTAYVEDPRLQASGMTIYLNNTPSPALRASSPARGEGEQRGFSSPLAGEVVRRTDEGVIAQGFTLIELLVVILIIGILAAVALPQHQKAVLKSHLTSFIPLVNAIAQAEEVYYLTHGNYTYELEELDIQIPSTGCTYITNDEYGQFYRCPSNGRYNIGVWNGPSNAQYQTSDVAYVKVFKDFTTSYGTEFKKGDTWCYSKNERSRAVCKSLGEGTEYESPTWKWQYRLKNNIN